MNTSILILGLLPIFVVILIGHYLKLRVIQEEKQWRGMERISFYLLIPCLIIKTLSTTDFSSIPLGSIAGVLLSSICIMVLILAIFYPFLTEKKREAIPAYTSIFQTSTRWNASIALVIVASLYGSDALAITAIGMVLLMPIINVVNVFMLTWCLTEGKVSLPTLLWKILSNPIVVGCFIGTLIGFLKIPVPQVVMDILAILGNTSLGIILLCVGAGLKPRELSRPSKSLLASCGFKLLLMPSLAITFSFLFNLEGLAFYVTVIISAMPAASNGYVLAKEMGGDAPLYSNAITLQVLISFIAIPLWLKVAALLESCCLR